jgi:hypothetical protein
MHEVLRLGDVDTPSYVMAPLVSSLVDKLVALPLQDALRVHAAASGPVLQLLATSDDNGILQSCCEYWRCVV